MFVTDALDARDLRLVQAIADAGGVTRAARRLHLSQSAVSHQLRGLEERLGVELFERRGRTLAITSAGLRLSECAPEVLERLASLEREVRAAPIERTKLRVGTECYTAYHWVPRALGALRHSHPEVDLDLSSDILSSTPVAFEEKRIDVALSVTAHTFGRARSARLRSVRLFEDELLLAVPRGHALAKKRFVGGGELGGETLILGHVAPAERERVGKLLFPPSTPGATAAARVIRVPVAEAVLELVEAGMGVSILPGFTLEPRRTRGQIEAVRLTRAGIRRTWSLVYRKHTPLEGAALTLADELREARPPSRR
ncbi:MAG TPA: LysR family transcriptional regulator [Polyangiaceae bacterium]|nr:LysR family transcriptional regulator [Polyangiaceae bacterium]